MNIYRVEHFENGDGPHAWTNRKRVGGLRHGKSNVRPCPDWIWNDKAIVRFGFRSLAQARRWFPNHCIRQHLRRNGFVLIKLSVPPTAVLYQDHAQVAFDANHANLIRCVGRAA